jgi:hypothetical protein
MRKEADSLPPNSAFADTIALSELHERRMKALFSRHRRIAFLKSAFKAARKTAAAICIALGLAFAALIANPQVHAAVKGFIIEVFGKFTRIEFTNGEPSPDGASWYPEWVPEGFELEMESSVGEMTRLSYKSGETRVVIKYSNGQSVAYSADNEDVEFHYANADGVEYLVGSAADSGKTNKILWEKGGFKFVVESALDTGTLLDIAKSVRAKD